ncbi:hypothetical protein GCM10020258_35150 [Sphingomonas yabuuchiae]
MVLLWVCASAGAEAAIAVAAPPTIMPRRDTVNSLLSANVPAPLHPVQILIQPLAHTPLADILFITHVSGFGGEVKLS